MSVKAMKVKQFCDFLDALEFGKVYDNLPTAARDAGVNRHTLDNNLRDPEICARKLCISKTQCLYGSKSTIDALKEGQDDS